MKLCSKCNRSPLPFVMIAVIAGVIAFTTWLMLGLSTLPPLPRIGVSLAAFFAVGGTLLHYVLSCLRRHCRHEAHECAIVTLEPAAPRQPGAPPG